MGALKRRVGIDPDQSLAPSSILRVVDMTFDPLAESVAPSQHSNNAAEDIEVGVPCVGGWCVTVSQFERIQAVHMQQSNTPCQCSSAFRSRCRDALRAFSDLSSRSAVGARSAFLRWESVVVLAAPLRRPPHLTEHRRRRQPLLPCIATPTYCSRHLVRPLAVCKLAHDS